MDIIINQNPTYTLAANKVQNKWWLELIERATGLTWILICNTKAHAKTAFKDCSLEEARQWMDRLKIEPQKVYKAGVV